jgi:mannitol-1-phosphate/altronate dehydrogenase
VIAPPARAFFDLELFHSAFNDLIVTVDTFKPEIAAALKAYEKYIVCLDKTPDDCELSLRSLIEKAIKAYENRGPHLRHGIALDKQVTIILSQTETERPLCGIYFNLHSPYQKKPTGKAAKSTEI